MVKFQAGTLWHEVLTRIASSDGGSRIGQNSYENSNSEIWQQFRNLANPTTTFNPATKIWKGAFFPVGPL